MPDYMILYYTVVGYNIYSSDELARSTIPSSPGQLTSISYGRTAVWKIDAMAFIFGIAFPNHDRCTVQVGEFGLTPYTIHNTLLLSLQNCNILIYDK